MSINLHSPKSASKFFKKWHKTALKLATEWFILKKTISPFQAQNNQIVNWMHSIYDISYLKLFSHALKLCNFPQKCVN